MNAYITVASLIIVLLFLLLAITALGGLAGYMITASCISILVVIVGSLLYAREDIRSIVFAGFDTRTAVALAVLVLFFLIFSIAFLPKTTLMFIDETIYDSIGIGILHTGNTVMCLYGAPYVQRCFSTELGFDPGGWPFIISIAFGIFGGGEGTSHGLGLFLGAATIVLVFFAANVISGRKEIGLVSAAVFSFIPQIYIWANTLANPNLAFTSVATFAIILFVVFLKRPRKSVLAALLSSIALGAYIRVEGLLLIPVFLLGYLVFGDGGLRKTVSNGVSVAIKRILDDRGIVLLGFAFLALLEPLLYVMIATTTELKANAAFYLYQNAPIFSRMYVLPNLSANLSFLTGMLQDYPIIFLPNVILFAVIGCGALLFGHQKSERRGILAFLLCFLSVYFVFYLFYFSGSVLVGASVRYLLILYPALSILSAFGIVWLGNLLLGVLGRGYQNSTKITRYIVYGSLVFVFFIVPFASVSHALIHPTYSHFGFPLNNSTQNLSPSPYTISYTINSLNFIQKNYLQVPSRCLVISEIPSIWFMLNRSATLPQKTDVFTNLSYRNYSCYYLDYGFWCTVSPMNRTICKYYTENYKLKIVATESTGRASNFSIYKILNYTG